MIEEPFIEATILTTDEFVGPILALARTGAASRRSSSTSRANRVMIVYELPFNEVILDFYDRLKTISRGYASLDYQFTGYRESDLVKMDILVNGEPVDALSLIVHKDKAYAARQDAGREDERAHPAADVRGGDPGGDRQPHHRPRDREGAAQERPRQVLRRRHHRASASCSRSRRKARSG